MTPVEYYRRNHTFHQLCSRYRAADVMVVAPYCDGMNLVAKEFVAARSDEGGSLVLSEFAGASASLPGAVLCNPFDIDDLKFAILAAVEMTVDEQRQRMRSMRTHRAERTVAHWACEFLRSLDGSPKPHRPGKAGDRPSPGSGQVRAGDRPGRVNGGPPDRDLQPFGAPKDTLLDARYRRPRRSPGRNDQ